MAQTIYDAMKKSVNPFTVALFKSIATSDELFSVLPFVPKHGEGFSYLREVSTGSFNFLAPGHTSVASSTGEDELVLVPKREAAEDFYVRNFAQENLGDEVDQLDLQTMKKGKAAGRTISNKVINGGNITGFTMEAFQSGAYIDSLDASAPWIDSDRRGPGSIKYTHTGTFLQFRAPGDRDYGPQVACASDAAYTLVSDNPSKWITVTLDVSDATADKVTDITFTSSTNDFDGLAKLVDSSQVRTSTGSNGDALTFAILDELIDSVKCKDNLAFIMPSALRRKYKNLERTMGGASVVDLPGSHMQVPSYEGIPILKNDWIGTAESKGSGTTLSSVYLASLAPEEGLWMGALGGGSFDVQGDPRDASVLGFRLYELGQSQAGSSSHGRRLAWFGGLALGSNLAAARASELVTA